MSLKSVFNKSSRIAVAFAAVAAPGAAFAAGPGLALGAVTFGAPWVLLGLGTLPALWWLMKSVPPKPKEVPFPAIRLLFNLKPEDQKPAKMPLWHRLLRTTAAAALIVGLAQPNFSPPVPLTGDGPLVLVVDNGWAAGRNWGERQAEMNKLIDQAERASRPVILLPTAPGEDGAAIAATPPLSAPQARAALHNLKPEPWPTDREAAVKALSGLVPGAHSPSVWLNDGLGGPGAQDLARALEKIGTLTVLEDKSTKQGHLLVPPTGSGKELSVSVRRADSSVEEIVTLSASDETGHVLYQVQGKFQRGEKEIKATFDVPDEIRNQIARISIDGENSAGAVVLLDERWRRRPVGVVETDGHNAHSLLSETSYIESALDPYVDLHSGSVDALLANPPAVLILPDEAALGPGAQAKIVDWVRAGGTVLRFAGPRLAAADTRNDPLIPVPLRSGSRNLDNAMTGTKPEHIAPFAANSPFSGSTPPASVTVEREVMAQPTPDLDRHTWARLDDGSPLVTARQEGKGWIVLVHTTANREWSNLALSGLFIDMMRAVIAHSQGVAGGSGDLSTPLPPLRTLDGRGQIEAPPTAVRPLTRAIVDAGKFGPQSPPGLYGNESLRRAYNLAAGVPSLVPLGTLPGGASVRSYSTAKDSNGLGGPLLGGAIALLLADLLILLAQRGALPHRRKESMPKGAQPKPDF